MIPEHEQKMWDILKERSHNEVARTVRLRRYAPVSSQTASNITKHWEKHGLVVTTENGARVMLTKLGAEVEDLSEVLD